MAEDFTDYEVELQLREAFFETRDYEKVKELLNTYEIDEKLREVILYEALKNKIWPVLDFWRDFDLPHIEGLFFSMRSLNIYEVMQIRQIFGDSVPKEFYYHVYFSMLDNLLERWQLDAVALYGGDDFYKGLSKWNSDNTSGILNYIGFIKKYGFNYFLFLMEHGIVDELDFMHVINSESHDIDDVIFMDYLFDELKKNFDIEFFDKMLTNFIEQYNTDLFVLKKLISMGAKSSVAPDYEEYFAVTDDKEFLDKLIELFKQI